MTSKLAGEQTSQTIYIDVLLYLGMGPSPSAIPSCGVISSWAWQLNSNSAYHTPGQAMPSQSRCWRVAAEGYLIRVDPAHNCGSDSMRLGRRRWDSDNHSIALRYIMGKRFGHRGLFTSLNSSKTVFPRSLWNNQRRGLGRFYDYGTSNSPLGFIAPDEKPACLIRMAVSHCKSECRDSHLFERLESHSEVSNSEESSISHNVHCE